MNLTTENDGKEFINVYSRGVTELGKFLTNFSHHEIMTEDGRFQSVEGYWGWLGSGSDQKEYYRNLFGIDAKKAMKSESNKTRINVDDFQRKIKKAIAYKIATNPRMALEFKNSKLPFVHFYDYKGRVVLVTDCGWIMEFLENLRKFLQMESHLDLVTDSLFNAPVGSILGHSCNTLGLWGSGVALGFKERFPESYNEQRLLCNAGKIRCGDYSATTEDGFRIVNLFASINVGGKKSPTDQIHKNTFYALSKFFAENKASVLCLPKINSGLFGCNWEEVKCVIGMTLFFYPTSRVVIYSPETKPIQLSA